MVKWAFATMPEQYQQLNDFIEEQNKIAMPSLSDDQLKISIDSSHINSQHQLAMISYWRNGYIQSIARIYVVSTR